MLQSCGAGTGTLAEVDCATGTRSVVPNVFATTASTSLTLPSSSGSNSDLTVYTDGNFSAFRDTFLRVRDSLAMYNYGILIMVAWHVCR